MCVCEDDHGLGSDSRPVNLSKKGEDRRSQISSNSFHLLARRRIPGQKELLRITYWLAYQGIMGGNVGLPTHRPDSLSCTVISPLGGPASYQMFVVMTLYQTVPDAAPAGLMLAPPLSFSVLLFPRRQMGWISIVIVLLFIIMI